MDDAGPDDDALADGDPAIAPTVPGRAAGAGPQAPLASGSDPSATWDLPDADRAAAPIALGAGAAIGRFVLRARLGEGGMGVVFAAEDPDLGRPVAVKLVRDDASPALRARLLREAQAMARLEHPNVVRVFEVGTAEGRLYVAMELVDGVTLTGWLAAAPRSWREIVDKFGEIGAGLAAVHRAGLVHRDFKPDNVLVDRGGHARVADFGLARLERGDTASPALAAPLTRTGAMMGTPGFMAPEQQLGGDVDARADQYSFCVALREALGARWTETPKAVRAVVTRGLSYDAGERFPSIEALLVALARGAGGGRGVWIAGGAVAFAAVGAIVVGVVASRGGVIERQVGVREPAVVARAAIVDAQLAAPPPPLVAVQQQQPQSPPPQQPPPVHAPPVRAPQPGKRIVDESAAVHPVPIDTTTPRTVPPAHLAAVRAAIADLGYQGLDAGADLAATEKSLREEREATRADGGAAYGIATVRLGMVLRRNGDCRGARALWEDAVPVFRHFGQDQIHWEARAWFGTGLCQLAAGNAAAAQTAIQYADTEYDAGTAHTRDDYAETTLALAIIEWERGDVYKLFALEVEDIKSPRMRALLDAWAKAVGAP